MIRHSTGIGARFTGHWYLSVLGNLLLWAIIAIDAWFLWPSSLGGATTLVIVSGNSMEPTYSDGDLVIARKGPVEIGDIVVYTPTEFGGAHVVHRVVGGNGVDGWEVQGDNNSWIDQWKPTDEQILGPVELHFGGAGQIAEFLIQPWLWGFILLAAVVLILWPEPENEDDEEPRNPSLTGVSFDANGSPTPTGVPAVRASQRSS
ncbi:MAG: S24/S26 family peptidase [Demequinaceae bacterium]|nr:S24/S26 family peptidase [Demequinaceae bacterium]